MLLIACSHAHAEEKIRLVVMQIQGPGLSSSERTIYRTALVEALSDRYIVLSGGEVDAKVREIFQKESKENISCDTEKCFQDIAVAFQAELIAACTVLKTDGGYMVNLQVNNVIENRSILAGSQPCRGCDQFDVIDKLKMIASNKIKPVPKPKPQADQEVLESSDEFLISVHSLIGIRTLNNDYWAPIEVQSMEGIDIQLGFEEFPLFASFGYSWSAANNEGVRGGITESSVGAGFHVGVFGLSVGAGFSTLTAEYRGAEATSDGLFLSGSGSYMFEEFGIKLGIDGKVVTLASVEILGVSGDVNYLQVSGFLGFEW